MSREKKWFLQHINTIQIEEQSKMQSLNRIYGEVLKYKKEKRKIDFSVWLDKKVLLLNVIVIIAEMVLVGILFQCEMNQQAVRSLLTVLPVGSAFFSIVGLSKIFYSKMAELSETCFFNVKQMIGIKLVLFSSLNVIYLFILSVCTAYEWQERFLDTALYIVVPYLISVCCYLGVLLTEAGRKNAYLMVVMGALLIVFYGTVSSISILYTLSMQFLWKVLLIASILAYGILTAILLRQTDKGEIVCMN